MSKYYTLFAGANGAGKTSLYNVLKEDEHLGERINIDEIVRSMGSWLDSVLQVKGALEAMRRIESYIDQGVNFHHETTLPGPTVIRELQRAKKAGYTVRLFFVGIDDFDLAYQRVRRRMEKGGHGVEEKVMRKRFEKLPEQMRRVLPLFDEVVVFDNTERFRQIAVFRDKIMLDCDAKMPKWYAAIF